MKAIDLTGNRFGRLVAIRLAGRRGKVRVWECRCDCGQVRDVRVGDLRSGASSACRGCLGASMIGQRFGKWTVVDQHPVRGSNGLRRWVVQCDCGNRSVSGTSNLRFGGSKSCGCIKVRHGHAKHRAHTPEYRIWQAMKARCTYPSVRTFPIYGGRGIKVCERWMTFENFLEDMGNKPSTRHSIDRYPDKDGDYEPGNCRWATPLEQGNNTRANRVATFNGKTMTMSEWSRELGISRSAMQYRIRAGWTTEKMLTTPKSR